MTLLADRIQGSIIFMDKEVRSEEIRNSIINIEKNIKKYFKENDKIIVHMERSPEMLMILYALFDQNITYIPIDQDMPSKRIEYIIGIVDASGVIVSSTEQEIMNHYNKVVTANELMIENESKQENEQLDKVYDDIISYILFTSGSTGNPKGVMIRKSSLLNLMEGVCKRIDYSLKKKILCLTTVGFDIFFLESIMAMYFGLDVVLADSAQQKNPREINKLIMNHQVDMVQMTPSRLQQLYNLDNKLFCLHDVKDIMIGGEVFPERMLTLLKTHTNARIYNMYGPTETTVWSTISDLTNKETIDLGEPIQNTRIFILNNQLEKVQPGEKGEIVISGAGVAMGYYKLHQLTSERFIELNDEIIYRTGDYGYYSEQGNLMYLGRLDHQVKIRGYRIELEEIDRAMMKNRDVSLAANIVFEEGDNKKLIGFYKADKEVLQSVLLQDLGEVLPKYMIPDIFIYQPQFPLNTNGKIDRKALEKIYINIRSHRDETKKNEHLLVQEELSNKVYQILKSFTEIDNFTKEYLEYSFHQLGLNSLSYISMLVQMEEEFEFEFMEDCLTLTYFNNLYELIQYINERIKEIEN